MYIDSISKTGGTQLTTHDSKLYIQDKLIWPYHTDISNYQITLKEKAKE